MRIATWNVNSLKARMPRVEEWLEYAQAQAALGVPALYYLEQVREDEPIDLEHLSLIGRTWDEYRKRIR